MIRDQEINSEKVSLLLRLIFVSYFLSAKSRSFQLFLFILFHFHIARFMRFQFSTESMVAALIFVQLFHFKFSFFF